MRTQAIPLVSALGLTVLLAGCSALRPLPTPSLASCAGPSTPQALWSCLEETDRAVGAGIRSPQPRESAYRATVRVTGRDLRRKRADQRARTACGGPVPDGFFLRNEPAAEPSRAPLRAYYHPPAPGRPTVVVVHGLYDSKHSRYVRLAAGYLAGRGYGVLVPDMRFHGCLLADWLPSLGPEEGRDLVAWGRLLLKERPESPVGLLGFSLGALDVVHALAAHAAGEVFRAGAVAVSPPADLPQTLTRLDDPPSFVDHGLLSLIRKFFHDAILTRMRSLGIPPEPGHPWRERPFDRFLAWLARQPSFPPGTTPESLVTAGDVRRALPGIRRPLLLIASRRDPVFPDGTSSDLEDAARGNPWVHLIETTDGGHIGHPGTYPHWTAEVLHRFFAASAGV